MLGRPGSGQGEDERDALKHVLSGGMFGTPKSAGQICRKFHFPNALKILAACKAEFEKKIVALNGITESFLPIFEI